MAADYPTTHGTKTVESTGGLRALLAALVALALRAAVAVGAVLALAAVASSGLLGAMLGAMAVFAAPVLLAWVVVRAVTRM
ncbi:MAG: hypothetical protein ABEJ05_04150 [Haloglomus sp.]